MGNEDKSSKTKNKQVFIPKTHKEKEPIITATSGLSINEKKEISATSAYQGVFKALDSATDCDEDGLVQNISLNRDCNVGPGISADPFQLEVIINDLSGSSVAAKPAVIAPV